MTPSTEQLAPMLSWRGAFLLSAFVLLAALAAVFGTLRAQADAARWVIHTREVLERIESTLSTVTDAETAQRGYLLTGDQRFLDLYRAAAARLPETLDALGRLTADNPVQGRALAAVRSEANDRLAQLARAVALQDAGDPAAALAVVRSSHGAGITKKLRLDFASMRAEEERLLEERSARSARANFWTLATVGAMGTVSILLLWLLPFLMSRNAAQIRLSEERLATTLASVGDGVIATDERGRIERMNSVAEELTGWTVSEARGRPLDAVFRIINEQSRATVESPLDKVLREGRRVGLANHTLLIAKDGTERPIEDSGAPIRGLDGSIAGVVLTFKDATERFAAERALRESEMRFRALADNIPTLCWMADETGAIFWYNRRWYEYTGTTLEQMQGWGWQALHDPTVLPQVLERWKRSIASGEPFEMVFPLKGEDGKFRDFLTRIAPVHDESGRVVRWFGSNTDVTEQRAAEAALREADRRKDEFLATLAHELRNPLAPIRNAVRLLKPDMPSTAQTQAREMIERQSAQMARLLDDLLDVSRITRSVIELRLEVLDVRRIVEDVILANRPLLERLHHELIVQLAGDPLWIEADPTRVHQILDNLLQNAAKYTDPGGRIEVTASAEADSIVLRVTDNGIGLAPESLEKVFDLFAQVHTSERGRSGLGIGLAVVKRIVFMHGGSIEAQSAGIGLGSCFRVMLPKAVREPRGEPLAPPERVVAIYRSRPRILLVDDQPDIVESLALLLRMSGYSLHTAEDGVSAVQIADTLRPDVMVIDLGMPRMDGYQVARWVRQQPWGTRATLIAVTGWVRNRTVGGPWMRVSTHISSNRSTWMRSFDSSMGRAVRLERRARSLSTSRVQPAPAPPSIGPPHRALTARARARCAPRPRHRCPWPIGECPVVRASP